MQEGLSAKADFLARYLATIATPGTGLSDAADLARLVADGCRELEMENAELVLRLPPRRMTKTYQHLD